jgi:hypothetical protein
VKTKNRLLQIIAREDNVDFHRGNHNIHIFAFLKTGMFKVVPVNHIFGPVITYGAVKKAESDECHWQQGNMSPHIWQVNLNIRNNRTTNRPSKPSGLIGDNLTGSLQRYGVLGPERNQNIYF